LNVDAALAKTVYHAHATFVCSWPDLFIDSSIKQSNMLGIHITCRHLPVAAQMEHSRCQARFSYAVLYVLGVGCF